MSTVVTKGMSGTWTIGDGEGSNAANVDVPKITDPGEAGWAEEPKVTPVESVLFGDQAGIVRRFAEAAVRSEEAYSLTCKHAQHNTYTDQQMREADEQVREAWEMCVHSQTLARATAARAIARHRSVDEGKVAEVLGKPE